LFFQLLTVLAEKPPTSVGYRGSDLVQWRFCDAAGHKTEGNFTPGADIATPVRSAHRA